MDKQDYRFDGTTICSNDTDISVDEGWSGVIDIPETDSNIVCLFSSNEDVATIDPSSGKILAKKAGIATIMVSYGSENTSFEIWVRGKSPVFMLHDRASNSFNTWGANNGISVNPLDLTVKSNDHYDPDINALCLGPFKRCYTSIESQKMFSYPLGSPINVNRMEDNNFHIPRVFNGEFANGEYTATHPQGGNLAYKLVNNGYKENISLFAFNYPNRDTIKNNAIKLKTYIENLISYVRTSNNDEIKTCFYPSQQDYNSNNYKINFVAHGSGGLVARYYIENLGNDVHVSKLITICTPHWGIKSSIFSNALPCLHMLCDHDIDTNSAMFGDKKSTSLDNGCNLFYNKCITSTYELTEELNYSIHRSTKYYAIASINCATINPDRDHNLEMPIDFVTYQQIVDFMSENELYNKYSLNEATYMDIKDTGDNIVGFLSQIGWTKDVGLYPNKKIEMYKIYISADTSGTNNLINNLHSNTPHREAVLDKVLFFLES